MGHSSRDEHEKDSRIVTREALARVTARRVPTSPTQLGKKGFFTRVKGLQPKLQQNIFSLWSAIRDDARLKQGPSRRLVTTHVKRL